MSARARSESTRSAVAAAVAVAAERGLHADEPVVLRDAWHVLVHLRPLPLVARVSSAIPFPEGPNPEDVVRELQVAGHAARAGAPVVPPADDVGAGPHEHGGHVVCFWRYVEPQGEVDPAAAGRGLRAIHDALLDFEDALAAFDRADEVHEMLSSVAPSPDVELLRELVTCAPDAAGQALHGDGHLGNCLQSSRGALWHDFETACRGPREYDLAALALHQRTRDDSASRAALAAYGPHDEELLEALVPVYAAWIYASFLVALPRRPELGAVLERRLAWLRSSYAS